MALMCSSLSVPVACHLSCLASLPSARGFHLLREGGTSDFHT